MGVPVQHQRLSALSLAHARECNGAGSLTCVIHSKGRCECSTPSSSNSGDAIHDLGLKPNQFRTNCRSHKGAILSLHFLSYNTTKVIPSRPKLLVSIQTCVADRRFFWGLLSTVMGASNKILWNWIVESPLPCAIHLVPLATNRPWEEGRIVLQNWSRAWLPEWPCWSHFPRLHTLW